MVNPRTLVNSCPHHSLTVDRIHRSNIYYVVNKVRIVLFYKKKKLKKSRNTQRAAYFYGGKKKENIIIICLRVLGRRRMGPLPHRTTAYTSQSYAGEVFFFLIGLTIRIAYYLNLWLNSFAIYKNTCHKKT